MDAIIHNGAIVNWQADFETLRAANVSSTVELLRAATTSDSGTKFVYISGGIKLVDTQTNQAAVAAQLSTDGTGYMQTKFLAESIVHNAATFLRASTDISSSQSKAISPFPLQQQQEQQQQQQQQQVSIVKPGVVLGAGTRSAANTDDYLWRVVAGAAAIRAYPSEPEDHWLYIDDAASVAQTILLQIGVGTRGCSHGEQPAGTGSFVDLQTGLPVPEFWRLVGERLGRAEPNDDGEKFDFRPLPWEEWIRVALAHMEDIGDSHPLWPVQHFLGRLASGNTPAKSLQPTQEENSRLHEVVRRNVGYLLEVGFIRSQSTGAESAREENEGRDREVFRRTEMRQVRFAKKSLDTTA